MKRQDIVALREKSVKELTALAKSLEKDISECRLEQNRGKGKNVHTAKNKRHDLARVLNVLTIVSMKEKKL